jgi:hypothetical protein
MIRHLLAAMVCVAAAGTAARAQPSMSPTPVPGPAATVARAGVHEVVWKVSIGSPPNDDGKKLVLKWKRDSMLEGTKLLILRHVAAADYVGVSHRYLGEHQSPIIKPDFLYPGKTGDQLEPLDASTRSLDAKTAWGDWTVVAVSEDQDGEQDDEVLPGKRYVYALVPVKIVEDRPGVTAFIGEAVLTSPRAAQPAWFDTSKTFFLIFVLLTGAAFLIYIKIAKRRGKEMFIRRIPGVDAIEDAVGRSTEMGRPVLYVTGIEEITSIQTIASLLILGHVAEMTAEYDTELKVANTYPMTMVVAEEIVRNSYTNVGRADAHRPENIMFITSEQFAFAAAVNGMIIRDRVATNIFLGKFFAESLILAETGFMAGAVQIAGTAEFTQLPFFVAACDYTLIGEELYATGAYLSREPNQIAQIKAGDAMKVLVVALILIGVVANTGWGYNLLEKLIP